MNDFSNFSYANFHVELTETCNASCPQCARNIFGAIESPFLTKSEITLKEFQAIFPKLFLIEHAESFSFGGNYGDPTLAKDLLDILHYIRTCNSKIRINLETNGGTKSASWFYKLGKILNSPDCYCMFSIDGLESTNEIYRKNVSWKKINENLLSFISAGGFAQWNYIVFRHNEHQVEKAKLYASSIGCKSFRIKKTGRMEIPTSKDCAPSIPVYDKDGLLQNTIELPLKAKYRNKKYSKLELETANPQHYQAIDLEKTKDQISLSHQNTEFDKSNNVVNTEIECQSLRKQSLYISASKHLFPCCFLGWPIKSAIGSNEEIQVRQFFKDLESISLNNRSIKEIVSGDSFKKISSSWISSKQLQICNFTCGISSNGRCLSSQTS